MNSYMYHQRFRPLSDFRINEIIEWLNLMQEAFGLECVYDSNDKSVELVEHILHNIFEKNKNKRFPEIGSIEHFFSIPPKLRKDETIRFEVHTGIHTGQKFADTYHVSIGECPPVPDFKYFRHSIEIFRPFEAYLSESKNEREMDAYDWFQAFGFSRPSIIRGFHYLDETFAESIGGVDYCLKAPVWKVERFCEGVLIQLNEGVFDTENPSHLNAQQKAMKYFMM